MTIIRRTPLKPVLPPRSFAAFSPRPKQDPMVASLVEAVLQALQMHHPRASQFLTIPEAADYTGLTQAYLRRQVRHGLLKCVRDRCIKVRASDLAKLPTMTLLAQPKERKALPAPKGGRRS